MCDLLEMAVVQHHLWNGNNDLILGELNQLSRLTSDMYYYKLG